MPLLENCKRHQSAAACRRKYIIDTTLLAEHDDEIHADGREKTLLTLFHAIFL